ncbi:hypothetical protein TpMuguga_04g00247 [Theileria parva strain Muguga]|uniref:Uncharacterized protein n=1 Tax=Theileria parva TaxID=5875 RepID=Q4N126_THEPA|nr:uncharacterized protein TpMuguga_04g00247 [Theileria parva strain Muguga]EAN31599.1 hypothetical protein TpMuguga_04g00247 [Theileria parva strain Muguga]|eukprot:XP_763882.1 hypothetical protein [Theileria parva strain Muguga]
MEYEPNLSPVPLDVALENSTNEFEHLDRGNSEEYIAKDGFAFYIILQVQAFGPNRESIYRANNIFESVTRVIKYTFCREITAVSLFLVNGNFKRFEKIDQQWKEIKNLTVDISNYKNVDTAKYVVQRSRSHEQGENGQELVKRFIDFKTVTVLLFNKVIETNPDTGVVEVIWETQDTLYTAFEISVCTYSNMKYFAILHKNYNYTLFIWDTNGQKWENITESRLNLRELKFYFDDETDVKSIEQLSKSYVVYLNQFKYVIDFHFDEKLRERFGYRLARNLQYNLLENTIQIQFESAIKVTLEPNIKLIKLWNNKFEPVVRRVISGLMSRRPYRKTPEYFEYVNNINILKDSDVNKEFVDTSVTFLLPVCQSDNESDTYTEESTGATDPENEKSDPDSQESDPQNEESDDQIDESDEYVEESDGQTCEESEGISSESEDDGERSIGLDITQRKSKRGFVYQKTDQFIEFICRCGHGIVTIFESTPNNTDKAADTTDITADTTDKAADSKDQSSKTGGENLKTAEGATGTTDESSGTAGASSSPDETLNAIDEALDSLDDSLNTIDETLVSLDEPVNTIDVTTNTIDEPVNTRDKKLGYLDKKGNYLLKKRSLKDEKKDFLDKKCNYLDKASKPPYKKENSPDKTSNTASEPPTTTDNKSTTVDKTAATTDNKPTTVDNKPDTVDNKPSPKAKKLKTVDKKLDDVDKKVIWSTINYGDPVLRVVIFEGSDTKYLLGQKDDYSFHFFTWTADCSWSDMTEKRVNLDNLKMLDRDGHEIRYPNIIAHFTNFQLYIKPSIPCHKIMYKNQEVWESKEKGVLSDLYEILIKVLENEVTLHFKNNFAKRFDLFNDQLVLFSQGTSLCKYH